MLRLHHLGEHTRPVVRVPLQNLGLTSDGANAILFIPFIHVSPFVRFPLFHISRFLLSHFRPTLAARSIMTANLSANPCAVHFAARSAFLAVSTPDVDMLP